MQFTNEQKLLIDDESTNKQVIISFPNTEIGNITNSKIYAEEMSLEGSLLDQDNFAIGKCNSDLFKVKVADFNEDIVNKEMVVTVKFTNESMGTELEVPFGRFIVNTIPERTSDRRYLIISAQDFMIKFDVDIADWYNTVLFTEEVKERTVSEILSMLCEYIGVEYDTTFELLHGDLVVKKNIEPTQLSGRDFLQQICELNACFGHFNELGVLSFVVLNSNANSAEISPYKNVDYEDYSTEKINSVQIRLEEDDIGATYTEDGATSINQLTITGNSLLFHLSSSELTTVAENIYNQIKDISFRPNETILKGGNYLNYGDKYLVNAKIPMENEVVVNTFKSYVLTRSINGIQGMSTIIGAKGSQYQPQIANDIVTQMKIINGRSAKVKADMESLKVEYKDFEKNVSSTIEQQAESVAIKIDKDGNVVSNLNVDENGMGFVGNKFVVDSENFSLDEDGKMTAKDGEFEGKVSATRFDIQGSSISIEEIETTETYYSYNENMYLVSPASSINKRNYFSFISDKQIYANFAHLVSLYVENAITAGSVNSAKGVFQNIFASSINTGSIESPIINMVRNNTDGTKRRVSVIDEEALTEALANYITNTALTTKLSSYVTKTSLNATLENYVENESTSSSATKSGLTVKVRKFGKMANVTVSGTTSAELATSGAYVTLATFSNLGLRAYTKRIICGSNYKGVLNITSAGAIRLGTTTTITTNAATTLPSGIAINVDETFILD